MRPLPKPPGLLFWLVSTGALPIVALAWVVLLKPEVGFALPALLSYTALILAFLGGIQWGRGLEHGGAGRLLLAIVPALYAWGALQLPPFWALLLMLLGLGGLLWIDLKDSSLPPAYRRLRLVVSVLVGVHLAMAAASPAAQSPQVVVSEASAMEKNVLGTPLQLCSALPRTGFYRNGFCQTGPDDRGTHTVCAVVTEDFLEFTLQRGNDLITPRPDYNFPGLNPGDRWCLCALRWEEARLAGVAPPLILDATHEKTLELIDRGVLERYAWRPSK